MKRTLAALGFLLASASVHASETIANLVPERDQMVAAQCSAAAREGCRRALYGGYIPKTGQAAAMPISPARKSTRTDSWRRASRTRTASKPAFGPMPRPLARASTAASIVPG